jgi:hypothetical protein
LRAGLTLADINEMCADEIDLWFEAIDARDESEFQQEMNLDNMRREYSKQIIESRRKAIRDSEYKWHDKLRLPVDLRKLRR